MSRKGKRINQRTVLAVMLLAILALLFFLMSSCGGMPPKDDYGNPSATMGDAPADIPVGGYRQQDDDAQESAKERAVREMDERLNRAYDLQDIE